jgi:subtilase family serine protease
MENSPVRHFNLPINKTVRSLAVALAAAATIAGCGGQSSMSSLPPQQAAIGLRSTETERAMATVRTLRTACGPVTADRFRCYAVAPHAFYVQPATSQCTLELPPCYGPTALRDAYDVTNLSASAGNKTTVAIVDAYAYPTAKSDLALYRQTFGEPALCATCFTIIGQKGTSTLPKSSDSSWDTEQAIDIDMVSAICPNCNIVLVEVNSSLRQDLIQGVRIALKHGRVLSLSFGGSEYAATSKLFDQHTGRVIVAAAGDQGMGPSQPCSFSGVVCVGGTTLEPRKNGTWEEEVWAGDGGATGSGCSAFVAKPSWQTDKGCTMRSEADLSAVGDPGTGIVVALDGQCCFGSVGGTSVATPIVASLYALAGNEASATPAFLWAHGGTSAFHDVTEGRNGFGCPKAYSYICKARVGYDGPTGWGTPVGLGAL